MAVLETAPTKERLWRMIRNPAMMKTPLRMKTRSPVSPEDGDMKCGPGTSSGEVETQECSQEPSCDDTDIQEGAQGHDSPKVED